MKTTFKYGKGASIEIDLAPDVLIANCLAATGMEDDAARLATQQALREPLHFPPLRQATVPGDHVVIALGPAVPQAAQVVAAIVPELLSGGASPTEITVLQASITNAANSGEAHQDPRNRLPLELQHAVQLVAHDPTHQNGLSYLAADAQGTPIYLNRLLCDADLVLPVGCMRLDSQEELLLSSNYSAVWNDTIYPTFSDRTTLDHFAQNGVPLTKGQFTNRIKQIAQIAWLLGVQLTAQVVPGSGNTALQVLAGTPGEVFSQGRTICQSAWKAAVPRRASLVVAGIGGDNSQQTWANVGRALEAALRVVNDDGAIVLCTELNEPLGPALKILIHANDATTIQARLKKQRTADATLARLLAESLDHVTIYLLSRLTEEVVTPLGLAYVNDKAEISRLITHHNSCILLPDAQYTWPTVAEKDA